MAEEELTPTQKLALAKNFIIHSPPAQTTNVIDDLRTLVGADVLTPDQELSLLADINKKSFAAVKVGGRKVLLTPHGELPGGGYMDPAEQCVLDVDHKTLEATKSDTPFPDVPADAEAMRGAVDKAMQQYVSDYMPGGVVTTYGNVKSGGVEVACCIASLQSDFGNYWAGSWKSEWSLNVPSGASKGKLTGTVTCRVHYFEDGNVQLDDRLVFQEEIPVADVGSAFAAKVKECDLQLLQKFEDIYTTLSEEVMQNLRRRLPITKMKFDWDKLAVSSLAKEMKGLGK